LGLPSFGEPDAPSESDTSSSREEDSGNEDLGEVANAEQTDEPGNDSECDNAASGGLDERIGTGDEELDNRNPRDKPNRFTPPDFIHLYCICQELNNPSLPMVQCGVQTSNACKFWYHYSEVKPCVNYEPVDYPDGKIWRCPFCDPSEDVTVEDCREYSSEDHCNSTLPTTSACTSRQNRPSTAANEAKDTKHKSKDEDTMEPCEVNFEDSREPASERERDIPASQPHAKEEIFSDHESNATSQKG